MRLVCVVVAARNTCKRFHRTNIPFFEKLFCAHGRTSDKIYIIAGIIKVFARLSTSGIDHPIAFVPLMDCFGVVEFSEICTELCMFVIE